MANLVEMGSTQEGIVNKLKSIPGYRPLFAKAFGTDGFTIEHVAKAIATFERTVLSGNSAYDRYQAGNKKAMTSAQLRGRKVFERSSATNATKTPSSPIMLFTISAPAWTSPSLIWDNLR
jgi:cytochrome c peroxidase